LILIAFSILKLVIFSFSSSLATLTKLCNSNGFLYEIDAVHHTLHLLPTAVPPLLQQHPLIALQTLKHVADELPLDARGCQSDMSLGVGVIVLVAGVVEVVVVLPICVGNGVPLLAFFFILSLPLTAMSYHSRCFMQSYVQPTYSDFASLFIVSNNYEILQYCVGSPSKVRNIITLINSAASLWRF
jgi:hypothetical protein